MCETFYYFLVAMDSQFHQPQMDADKRRCPVNKSAFIRGSLYFSTDQKKLKSLECVIWSQRKCYIV